MKVNMKFLIKVSSIFILHLLLSKSHLTSSLELPEHEERKILALWRSQCLSGGGPAYANIHCEEGRSERYFDPPKKKIIRIPGSREPRKQIIFVEPPKTFLRNQINVIQRQAPAPKTKVYVLPPLRAKHNFQLHDFRQQSSTPAKPQVFFLKNHPSQKLINSNYVGSSSDTNSRYYLPDPNKQSFVPRSPLYGDFLTPPRTDFEPRVLMSYNDPNPETTSNFYPVVSNTAKRHAQESSSSSEEFIDPASNIKLPEGLFVPPKEDGSIIPDRTEQPMKFSEILGLLTPRENETESLTESPVDYSGSNSSNDTESESIEMTTNLPVSSDETGTENTDGIEVTEEVTEATPVASNNDSGSNEEVFFSSEENEDNNDSVEEEDPSKGYNYYRYVVNYEPRNNKEYFHRAEPEYIFHPQPQFEHAHFNKGPVHRFSNLFSSRTGEPVRDEGEKKKSNKNDGFEIIPAKYISYSLSVSPI